ncbi:hypothetical protein BRADI_1g31940v3 [Brachypodium distachyon]|uniref:F-box protein At3g26010-like beta-propeller domain-containing protein n=1 Tax=Brachypodium distachyon TaxID=15368 RepID=A0A0Q3RVU7_BRADI|nr:hypothetical protein BRADI_1g31940v3 [Brachypodium distachyon]
MGSTRVRSTFPPHGGMAAERLTDDILVEILSRVPAKSLCRFNSTVKDSLPESALRFTNIPGSGCPMIDASFAFVPNHWRLELLDCSNGLVLCRWYAVSAQGDEFRYVVCNPAMEQWAVLPDSGQTDKLSTSLYADVSTVRLGFDPAVSSHFHVFELSEEDHWDPDLTGVAVYSSETGRWVHKEKRWHEKIRLLCHPLPSATVFLNDNLHFQADGRCLAHRVAAVDTEGETWTNFAVPAGLVDGFIQRPQGRLHYANFQWGEDGVAVRLVVCVLEDYDSKEWILKHSFDMSYILEGIDVRLDLDFDWVAIHPECNLIFFTLGWDVRLMCYNMDCRQVKVICKCEDGQPPYLPYVPLYAELPSLHA